MNVTDRCSTIKQRCCARVFHRYPQRFSKFQNSKGARHYLLSVLHPKICGTQMKEQISVFLYMFKEDCQGNLKNRVLLLPLEENLLWSDRRSHSCQLDNTRPSRPHLLLIVKYFPRVRSLTWKQKDTQVTPIKMNKLFLTWIKYPSVRLQLECNLSLWTEEQPLETPAHWIDCWVVSKILQDTVQTLNLHCWEGLLNYFLEWSISWHGEQGNSLSGKQHN